MTRRLVAAFFLSLAVTAAAAQATTAPQRATRIHVDKSERKMFVYAGDALLVSYPIGLGLNPLGHKQQQGDRRTPEGKYVLDYKNPHSAFYRSIHISYPNAADRASARRRGVDPGGLIMIHGMPNDPQMARRVRAYGSADWTDGCIALSDENMEDLWNRVQVPVPIEIAP